MTTASPSPVGLMPALTPVGVCKGLASTVVLALSATLGSVFMMGPILPLMVLRPSLFRWLTDWMMSLWLLLPVAVMEVIFGVTIATSGDSLRPDEGSIIIMNHRTRLDWMFFWAVLSRQSTLRTEKIILKNDPKMLPGFGWAMQVAGYIFLKRRWDVDRPWLLAMLQYYSLLKYKGQFLIFPEGTNYDAKTKASSDRFAKKNNLPEYQYCLHPRTTGLVFLTQELRQENLLDTMYDVTVTYSDLIPEHGEANMVVGSVPARVNFHIRRHPQASLPSSKEGLESWCTQRWREKEGALGAFYTGATDRVVYPDAEGDHGPVVTHGSNRPLLCAVLLYWLAFIVLTSAMLFHFTPPRWYFAAVSLFYVAQLLFRGGVETAFMDACRWRHGKQKPS